MTIVSKEESRNDKNIYFKEIQRTINQSKFFNRKWSHYKENNKLENSEQ